MKLQRAVICLLIGVAAVACAPESDSTTNTAETPGAGAAAALPPVDFESLAQQLVHQNARVKENDYVLISGGASDIELMENIAVHVRKAGAFPIVRLTSDRMTLRTLVDVPEQYSAQPWRMDLKLAEFVNVRIEIESLTTGNLLGGVEPKRRDAWENGNEAAMAAYEKRNVRQVFVGNSLYPADWRAAQYGLSVDQLTATFWKAVHTDYAGLQATAEQIRKTLSAGNELHITNPNGTDLTVRIQGRPILVSDGIVSPDDERRGGAAATVWLPAGEVYLVPIAGTANGKVVQTRGFSGGTGKEIQDLTLTFEKGKVVAMTGQGEGFQDLTSRYDAAGAGKDAFAFVDFGINPNVKLSANAKTGTWVPAGTITVGIGANSWAGGENTLGFGQALFLPGSTATLDGKVIVENGELRF
jgi:leucyl aminopeptidase (aminopeptidase T)